MMSKDMWALLALVLTMFFIMVCFLEVVRTLNSSWNELPDIVGIAALGVVPAAVIAVWLIAFLTREVD